MPRIWLVGALIVGLAAGLVAMRWRDDAIASQLKVTSFLSMSSDALQAAARPLSALGLPQSTVARGSRTDRADAVELAALSALIGAEMTPPPKGGPEDRQLSLLVEVIRSLPSVAVRYGSYTAGGRVLTAKERDAARVLGEDLKGLHFLSNGISSQLLRGQDVPSAEWSQMKFVLKKTLAEMVIGDH